MKTWGRWGRESLDTLRARFQVSTRQNGTCVEWTGAARTDGRYGICRAMGKFWLAHRLAYTLFAGPIPKGMCVCHSCDNGICVNTKHLFIGSQRDNVIDMEMKGRSFHKKAEHHGRAKLTWTDVRDIRRLHDSGQSTRKLAKQFTISRTNVRYIVSRKTWKE